MAKMTFGNCEGGCSSEIAWLIAVLMVFRVWKRILLGVVADTCRFCARCRNLQFACPDAVSVEDDDHVLLRVLAWGKNSYYNRSYRYQDLEDSGAGSRTSHYVQWIRCSHDSSTWHDVEEHMKQIYKDETKLLSEAEELEATDEREERRFQVGLINEAVWRKWQWSSLRWGWQKISMQLQLA